MKSIFVFALVLAVFEIALDIRPGLADIYVYQDGKGVLHFSNVPTQSGFRRFMRDGNSNAGFSSNYSGRYEDLIRDASDRHSVDPDLIRAVIRAESGFDSAARSHKGAMGLMQLMPDTAKLHNVYNIYDPGENIDGGVKHLRLLLSRYHGDLQLVLAAYNAGIKAVEKYGGIPPFSETREYIRKVLRFYDGYRGGGLRVSGQSQP